MTTKALLCCSVVIAFAISSQAQSAQPATPENKKASTVSPPTKANTNADLLEGKVVRVENGDTITMKGSGDKLYLVKLQAIDAPDVGQPRFEDSKNSLSKLIRGKNVRLVVHATGPSGVMIGTVYYKGRDVGLSLLEAGLAWHYNQFPFEQTAASRKTYSDAQNAASAAGLGVWTEAAAVPPWVFRGEVVSSGPAAATVSPNVSANPQTSDRKYTLGPRGGCYYVSESGAKVYVQDKKLCGATAPESKP